MKIKEKENPNIHLEIPQFLCDDNAVSETLNEHDLLQYLNVYGLLVVIGKAGSGKTSFCLSLITQKKPKIYKKTHHHILICMPSNSIHSLKKNPLKVLPENNFYDELNFETITDISERLNAYSNKNEKSILFIDDQTASLKNKNVINELKKIIYNRRHLKTNIIICVQSYVNIPLDIRKSLTNIILFKPSKKEMQLVFDENLEQQKDNYIDIMKYVFKEPHNYMFLNVPSQSVFRNQNRLLFESDESDEEK